MREELRAEVLAGATRIHNIVQRIVIGAMGPANVRRLFQPDTLLICPADREDVLRAAAEATSRDGDGQLAGIILSDDIQPTPSTRRLVASFPCPVLLTRADSYSVASAVHDLTVKTRPDDTQKIRLIRDMISRHVNLDRILERMA